MYLKILSQRKYKLRFKIYSKKRVSIKTCLNMASHSHCVLLV